MSSTQFLEEPGFSWADFDKDTILALAGAMGQHSSSILKARKWLESRVPKPTLDFVRDYKKELLKTWLFKHEKIEDIVYRLIDAGVGPMGVPSSKKEYLEYIQKTKNTKTLQTIIRDAMLRHSSKDPDFFIPGRSIILLKPPDLPDDSRKPHSYQTETWAELNLALAKSQTSKRFQGLIVMPTGSGKTYTAVHWLLSSVIVKSYRVLWVAHRHELLNQAAMEFMNLAHLAKSSKQELRLRIVSGMHCKSSQICREDDVVVASVSSLAHNPDKVRELIDDPNLFLVIDEAHHAPATSYRRIVEQLRQKGTFRILGITATPTRTIKKEQPDFWKLFGRKIINQVAMRELIEKEILAEPRIRTVKTHAEAEKDITLEDREHLLRFHDLSDDWLDRIAHIVERNTIIVQHYLDEKDRYGPTLIFAINVRHAALLTEALRKKRSAEYVASYRPDGSEGEVIDIVQKFRKGIFQVLVNVQMLTVGIDLPKVQTVFLTRPTASEILVRQMIGRGLRGPKMNGTQTAYLVSFEDHWQEFNDWESPFDLVPDVKEIAEVIEVVDGKKHEELLPELPLAVVSWDVIRFVAKRIGELKKTTSSLDFFEAIPHGWYVLEDQDGEGEERQTIIPLYDHDFPCWKALVESLMNFSVKSGGQLPSDQQSLPALQQKCFEDFFGDCDYPRPSKYHVSLMVDYLIRGGNPKCHDYEDRMRCDPYK